MEAILHIQHCLIIFYPINFDTPPPTKENGSAANVKATPQTARSAVINATLTSVMVVSFFDDGRLGTFDSF